MNRLVKKLGVADPDAYASGRKEKQRARALYEEVFSEDSKTFVDYYFQVKAAENEIYVVEDTDADDILATLHLNPYKMEFCGHRVDTSYIVAVATRRDCRHHGLMASLLYSSLCDLYDQGSPFTWLMPAAEAIYRPFGFRFIYRKNHMILSKKACNTGKKVSVCCREAKRQDLDELADFAKQRLPQLAQVYTVHDRAYFAQRMLELSSEGGSLVLFLAEGKICGYFLASAEKKEAWEIVVGGQYEEDAKTAMLLWFGLDEDAEVKVSAFPRAWEQSGEYSYAPAIMGRIVHLERFVRCLCLAREKEWHIKLQDDIIAENNGSFRITVGKTGCTLTRLEGNMQGLREMEIGSLLEEIFDTSVWLNEVV